MGVGQPGSSIIPFSSTGVPLVEHHDHDEFGVKNFTGFPPHNGNGREAKENASRLVESARAGASQLLCKRSGPPGARGLRGER